MTHKNTSLFLSTPSSNEHLLDGNLDKQSNKLNHDKIDLNDLNNLDNDLKNEHTTAVALSRYIEVLLHASESPLTADELKKHLMISQDEFEVALALLESRLSSSVLSLAKTASGYRLQIKDTYSRIIHQVFPERQETLSQALLETLSVIAYKQPVTRSDIEHIRGVSVSSHILRQLFDKGWIVEKGHKDVLGRPALLHTTKAFLDAFGLSTLEELPDLPDLETFKVQHI